AGAANPPPACSACSGGSTDGYPYSFGSKGNGNWTFWFDWITKARVNLSGSGNTIQQLFYVGEVNATGVTMSQRTALVTMAAWNGSWVDAAPANTYYNGGASCSVYGLAPQGTYTNGNQGTFHSLLAGSGAGCATNPLW
ncbi:MAG TPA: hypothetical protein VGR71_01290, partial [Nitrospira sp.]|nr:hypothetical protein [Nitrospira sp.]